MIALITGASRGIGRAIALRLAQDYSATLVLVYRSRKADAEETAQQCRVHGSTVHIEQVDVGQSAEADRLVKATIERHGRIDVLINNAGITADGLTLQMSDDDWHNVLNTNTHSVFYLARAVARPMMMKKHGRIINISSISARRPNRGQANYAASKGAIEAFTRAMAVEDGFKKDNGKCSRARGHRNRNERTHPRCGRERNRPLDSPSPVRSTRGGGRLSLIPRGT